MKTIESNMNETLKSIMISDFNCNELMLLLLSLSPSLLSLCLFYFISRDDHQSLDNHAITFFANGFITLASSLNHKFFHFFFLIHSGYSFVSLCLHCMLYHVSELQNISLFLSSILTAELSTYHSFSILTLFYSIRTFSCSLSKYGNSACCYLCLHRPDRSMYGDYPNNLFLQSSNTCVDMNQLFYTLFQSLYQPMITIFFPRLSSSTQPSDEDLSIMESYCCVVSSLIYHSLSILSFIINQEGNLMLRSVNYLQNRSGTNEGMQSSWLFQHHTILHDFLWKHVLSIPHLFPSHCSGVIYLLFSYVYLDEMCEGVYEDLSTSMLHISGFRPLLELMEAIEDELKTSINKNDYLEQCSRYQPMVNGILSVIGAVCVNMELFPSMMAHFSLLIIHLFHWVMVSHHWIVSDLSLLHLIHIARYSIIIHKKSLWVLLPECIIAEIIQSLLSLDQWKQQLITQSVFDNTETLSQWYMRLTPYVLPVYINQLDTQTIVKLCRAIDSTSSIYHTLTLVFQGAQCIYNVIVYLLKHMSQENTKAWELLFFLRSSFTDQAIEEGNIIPPESSRVSIKQMIQQQGHRVLWPLLYDCTDISSHDRDMSETALRSLYE